MCGPGTERMERAVDEAMFRTGEVFAYGECSKCGSLQMNSISDDLGSYYDTDRYYSFKDQTKGLSGRWLKSWPVRRALKTNTEIYLRSGKGKGLDWARAAGLRTDDRILDFGCGAGRNLLRLHLYGFKHLAGADPFLAGHRAVAPGVQLTKAGHAEINGQYDWVMMHHTFEHVPDPRETLRSARRLLRPNGRILIRMPIMGKAAWRRYGTSWAQIDAPRHLVLYTDRAIAMLAESEGFRVARTFYDSTAFQFWGSECVLAGRPFSAGRRDFSEAQIAAWSVKARQLNANQDGDQAGIVLCDTGQVVS